MPTRLAWALPLLLILSGCEKRGTKPPGHDSSTSSRRIGHRDIKPLEVCEHLAKVAADEAGLRRPAIDAQLMNECESELAIEAARRGTDDWNAFADCVLGSRTEVDLQQCNRTHPLPGQGAIVVTDGSRELEVCEHMIEVLMLETAAQTGEVPTMTAEERDVVEEECARSLITEQKPQRSDWAYQEMLDCIELAQTKALMQACE